MLRHQANKTNVLFDFLSGAATKTSVNSFGALPHLVLISLLENLLDLKNRFIYLFIFCFCDHVVCNQEKLRTSTEYGNVMSS